MAVLAQLATVAELATLLRITIAAGEEDPYAVMILGQASTAVREAAGNVAWVRLTSPDTEPGVGQVEMTETAHDITLWVASRAYNDPRNKSRRTAGPISESYFENGVYGLDLTEREQQRLDRANGGASSGLWVQPLSYGEDVEPILAPSDLGYWYLGDSDQFPYGNTP